MIISNGHFSFVSNVSLLFSIQTCPFTFTHPLTEPHDLIKNANYLEYWLFAMEIAAEWKLVFHLSFFFFHLTMTVSLGTDEQTTDSDCIILTCCMLTAANNATLTHISTVHNDHDVDFYCEGTAMTRFSFFLNGDK